MLASSQERGNWGMIYLTRGEYENGKSYITENDEGQTGGTLTSRDRSSSETNF